MEDANGVAIGEYAKRKPKAILFSDIDGVMTDGTIAYLEEQQPALQPILTPQVRLVTYSVFDGAAISILRSKGIEPVFITHKVQPPNKNHRKRFRHLRCNIIESLDKRQTAIDVKEFLVGDEEVLTGAIGDDIYDTGMLLWADYCFCPSTAHNGVIDIVTNVAKTTGQGLVIPKMYKAGINLYRWTSELFASWALESGR